MESTLIAQEDLPVKPETSENEDEETTTATDQVLHKTLIEPQ
jgi:hypothetical protein